MPVYLIHDELHRIIGYYTAIEPMLEDLFNWMKSGKIVYYKKEEIEWDESLMSPLPSVRN